MNKVIVDKARLLRRVIVISWVSLGLCFLIKIFGGNFFEIVCDNAKYKAICEYADSHLWLKYTLGVISSLFCEVLYLLAILQEYRLGKKRFLITVASVLAVCLVKLFNNKIGAIGDIWIFFVLPYIFIGKKFKKMWWQVPVAYALTFSFQLLSLLVKNLSIGIVDESTFISLIYMIDVYIMCFLYYLYRNYQKEKKDMGIFWGIFAGTPTARLEKMKADREAKIKKYEEEKKAIEVELSKRKNNEK